MVEKLFIANLLWHMHKRTTLCVERNVSHVEKAALRQIVKIVTRQKDNRFRKNFFVFML